MLADTLRTLPLEALKKLVEREHEDLDGPFGRTWWKLVRESYEHGERFRACLETDTTAEGEASYTGSLYATRATYLQRFPRENLDVFRRRLRSSTYENHVAPVVDVYHGHLTRREPQRSSDLAAVSAWWASADASGRGVQPFMSDGIRQAQLDGWAACLFDRPRGDVARAEARTVAQWLSPDEVRDWQFGADGRLDWALLRSDRVERDPVTGEKSEVYDCTLWTRREWARVVLREEGERYAAELVDGAEHGLGRVPLAVLYWQRPLTAGRLYGVSQVNDVVPLNLALFNRRSELTHHLRSAVFALLCVQSDDESVFSSLKVGTHNGIRYATGTNAPHFIAPPADVAATLAAECIDLRSAIYVAAKVERPRAESSGDTRSGVARAYDFAATEASLLSAVANLEAFEREAASIVALWDAAPIADPAGVLASVADRVRVEYPSSFDAAGLARDLTAALDLLAPDRVTQMLPSTRRAARLRIAHAIVPDATATEKAAIAAEAQKLYDAETAQAAGVQPVDLAPGAPPAGAIPGSTNSGATTGAAGA